MSLNNWEVHDQDVLDIAAMLEDRENIVFLSPEEAFAAVNAWQKGSDPNTVQIGVRAKTPRGKDAKKK